MRALAPEAPPVFRTQAGGVYARTAPARALAPDLRASKVTSEGGDAVLVELAPELLEPASVAADRLAAAQPHVITAREIGTLIEGERESAYRAPARSDATRHYALLPALYGQPLSRSLAAARGGRVVAWEVVATIAVEVASALADTGDTGPLTPDSILVTVDGRSRVRGALLAHVASQLELRASRARPRFAYLAPEMVGQSGGRMDARGRLFALGLMLLELSLGRPMLREHPSSARALADWSISSAALPADAPHALRAGLWGLLQRDPERRPSPSVLIELLASLYGPGTSVAQALGIQPDGPAPYL